MRLSRESERKYLSSKNRQLSTESWQKEFPIVLVNSVNLFPYISTSKSMQNKFCTRTYKLYVYKAYEKQYERSFEFSSIVVLLYKRNRADKNAQNRKLWSKMEKIAYDLSKKKKDKIKWKKDGRIKRDKCSTTDSQEEASIFYRDYIFHWRIVMAPKSLLVSFACNAQCNIQSIKKVGDLNFKVCIFTSYGRYRISRETLAKNPLLCFVSFY